MRSVGELRKFLLRGTEEQKKLTTGQRIGQIAFPFLMFILVRNMVLYLMVLLLGTVGSNTSGGAFLFIRNDAGELEGLTANAALLSSSAGFAVSSLVLLKIARKTISRTAEDMRLMHIKGEPAKHYAFLGLAVVGLTLGLNLALQLLGAVGNSESYQEVAQTQYAAWFPLGLFCYGIISPLAEELLFRGIFYNCFRRYMKLSAAMMMSAALFALYHGNSVQGIYGLLMGCLMVYAYEYFGDFRMPVAVHMLANILAYGLSFLGTGIPLGAYWPICIVSLACGGAGLWLLNKEKKVF